MKAIICEKYGPPEDLVLKDVEKPTPKGNEILVEMAASSINYNILAQTSGEPFLARLMGLGLLKPKDSIPGGDIAGRVAAVGPDVKQFKPGDEVFGDSSDCGYGAFAEYACVPESCLAFKPANLSFKEAAAASQAAVVALQGLVDFCHIKAGQKVLIYGASGGIGTYAVQIAKYFKTKVTAVCSATNFELMRSLGADFVLDYSREDFTQSDKKYDIILATAGYRSIFDYQKALKPGGAYVAVGGAMHGPRAMSQIYEALLLAPLLSKMNGKKMGALMMVLKQKDLVFIKDLFEAGHLKSVIDRVFPLEQASEALCSYTSRHTRGKLVIQIKDN